MGNRLSKISTRTGDDGSTGLGDGSRVSKDSLRIHAIGDIDELNSHIGVLLCESIPDDIRTALIHIQHDLFDLGGELCIPTYTCITESHVLTLDNLLSLHNNNLPPLAEFILPGGARTAALAHICRTVCRRAERSIVTLHTNDPLNIKLCQYVNRLSDLFFVFARVLNLAAQQTDVFWKKNR